ncbi:hypothetical protein ISS03_05715 [Patescibacteria group bacterium]|nr:hypothetical protein [Patescibacteria group bacterium]
MNVVLAANLKDAFKTTDGRRSDPLDSAAKAGGYDIKSTYAQGGLIIANAIKTVLGFLGVIFVILMIYGGYTWMMARGNEQDVEKAKSTIRNAVIGLIIVVSAYAISVLVVSMMIPETKKTGSGGLPRPPVVEAGSGGIPRPPVVEESDLPPPAWNNPEACVARGCDVSCKRCP